MILYEICRREGLYAIASGFDASCKSILRSSNTSRITTSDSFALRVVESSPRYKLVTVMICLCNNDDRSGFATTVEQQLSQGHTWGVILAAAIQQSSLRFDIYLRPFPEFQT
jgi:hypothetical protein